MILNRDIKFREAAHGHEEHPDGTQIIRRGTPVVYVGESKVRGWMVIKHGPTYVRVRK